MPNIAARSNLPAATPAATAADLSTSASRAGSRRGGRAERGTAFDEVLSGARRREPAPSADAQPKPVKSKGGEARQAAGPDGSEPTAKTEPAKSKPRAGAARQAKETAEAEQAGEEVPTAAAEPEAPAGDAVDQEGEVAAPAPEDEAPAAPRRVDAEAPEPLNPTLDPNLPLAEQLPAADPIPGSTPDSDLNAPGDPDELPADAVAEGTPKLAIDAAVADPKHVLGDQPTPVLLGEIAQAQQAAPAAPLADTPGPDVSTTAGGSPATLPSAVSRVAAGPQPAATTEHATRTPHLEQPAPDGAAFGERPVPTGLTEVASNSADVVQSLEPSEDAAAAPAGAPAAAAAVATQAAPDPTAAAAAATRALESLGGQNFREAVAPTPTADAPQLPPEVQFAEDNHPNIVTGVRGQLMPTGGTMQIRLDPPELGPLAVTIRLNDGVMEASFETSNDQAAKLLSHSLSALKTSLEAQGITVDRLHVQQAPKSEQANQQGGNGDSRDPQQNGSRDPQQDHAARQEHQRKEMLRRMWAKLRGAEDPLDMVA